VVATSRNALVLGLLAILLMPLGGLGNRTGVVPLLLALLAGMVGAALLGAAATIIGGYVVWRGGRRPSAIAGMVLGLVTVGTFVYWLERGFGAPSIHDISTDIANPPTFEAVVPLRGDANTLEYDPQVGAQQQQAYPDVVPLTLAVPPAEAFERALAAAQDNGWEIVGTDRQRGRLEAIGTTFWYGFKDDVVIRITPAGAAARVDIRSVSRLGRNDLETNARRIRRYLNTLRGGSA
jgi:uncharacterized protein (DUF1499 family)